MQDHDPETSGDEYAALAKGQLLTATLPAEDP